MLVLALQFSKGIAGVGIVYRHRSDVTLTGHAVAVELEELVPGERVGHVVRLPQNGREDKVDRFEFEAEDESYDVSNALDRPTSAPTGNWFEPDRTDAGQRLNSSSLERR
jgi:hypothetical protein